MEHGKTITNWHFKKTSQEIKNFQFTKGGTAGGTLNTDELLWRNWNVTYAVRYAIKFSKSKNHNFVEVGVADGISSFYALREIKQHKISEYKMYLYDTWGEIKQDDLDKNQTAYIYSNLSIERTKKNLSEFNDKIVFHQGYVPDTFADDPPESISYLHIDLSSAESYLATLEFFYPRLVSGGAIIFDDYGSIKHYETKQQIDDFLQDKEGIFQKLPTRQAIFYRF